MHIHTFEVLFVRRDAKQKVLKYLENTSNFKTFVFNPF